MPNDQKTNKETKGTLLNKLPSISEIESMMAFCKKYDTLYLYGMAEEQRYLLKYFDMCGIKMAGYVVADHCEDRQLLDIYPMPVYTVTEMMEELKSGNKEGANSTGIIFGVSDSKVLDLFEVTDEEREFIELLQGIGFADYFVISPFNRRTITKQIRPRVREHMSFEINLADHCNLSCQMCDHYSQLSEERFLDLESFERDVTRMGELFEHKISFIILLGGEPTLNRNLIECIKIARREFPDCRMAILTNGTKLLEWEHAPEGNLWQVCKDHNVRIEVTIYPIKLDYQALEDKAKEYDIEFWMSSNIHAEHSQKAVKISDKHPLDPTKSIEKCYCVSCLYFNKFNVLKDGKLYMCPIAAHSVILNKRFGTDFELGEKDYIDIYQAKSWTEIAELCASHTPFCSYCDLKHWGPYSEWKPSRKTLDEYI